jgi:hypothetical protein
LGNFCADIYAVMDNRYLISVASPFAVKSAISVLDLLRIAPPGDLYLFELWEDIALQMLGEADLVCDGQVPQAQWESRWSKLIGGRILTKAVQSYMESGTLSAERKAAVIELISQSRTTEPELAENLLLRLCGSVSRSRITHDQAVETLRCKHFRTNLTLYEVEQMVACWTILKSSGLPGLASPSLDLLTIILSGLEKQPYSMAEDWERFEYAPEATTEDFHTFIERHNLRTYNLFLQEHASAQPFITLKGRA